MMTDEQNVFLVVVIKMTQLNTGQLGVFCICKYVNCIQIFQSYAMKMRIVHLHTLSMVYSGKLITAVWGTVDFLKIF